jgi:hypothetical protein
VRAWPLPHLAYDHQAGVDPEPNGKPSAPLQLEACIQLLHGLRHSQPGPYGPLGVIFVREGVAEVDDQPIAQILRDMPQ